MFFQGQFFKAFKRFLHTHVSLVRCVVKENVLKCKIWSNQAKRRQDDPKVSKQINLRKKVAFFFWN